MPSDGVQMDSFSLSEGNKSIYGLEMMELSDSPDVAMALLATEDALLGEALSLKQVITGILRYKMATSI